MVTLQLGSTGPDVTQIQNLLLAAGESLAVTGTFDQATLAAVQDFQGSHVGPDGSFLDVDGTVGPNTLFALLHPTASTQENELKAELPAGLDEERTKVLDTALIEWGKRIREEPLGSNHGPEVDKYGAGGGPWCAGFVAWCVKTALNRNITSAGYALGCLSLLGGARKDGFLVNSPLPGDIWIMIFEQGAGHHTGICLRVSPDKQTINTIEGNCSDRVQLGTRKASTITYWIRPYNSTPNGIELGLLSNTVNVSGSGTV